MRYILLAEDGGKYGPADTDTLNTWIGEGRLIPSNLLQEEISGRQVLAVYVSELNFPEAAAPQFGSAPPSYAAYPRVQPGLTPDTGSGDVTVAWVCAVLSAITCPLLAVVAIIFANKAIRKGNPSGRAARVLAIGVLSIYTLILFFALYGSVASVSRIR